MKKILLKICLILLPIASVNAQTIVLENDDSKPLSGNFWANSTEVGLNCTPLLSKFVPFNLGPKATEVIGIKTKVNGENIGFKFAFGSDINAGGGNSYFYMSIGYEKRRPIAGKFTFTSGWDGVISFNQLQPAEVPSIFGLGKFFDLEYNINDRFFIGTEAEFYFGIPTNFDAGNVSFIKFMSPTSLYFNIRLPNKMRLNQRKKN
jgi:hypothetical protein